MTCGVQFAPSSSPPTRCDVCEDERQYVGWSGQQWGTLEDLQRDHINEIREDFGLTGIGTKPSFAIGQRALLVRSPGGNLLWDCITLLDDVTVASVRELGGVRAIAISHPHYYSSMVEWSRCFNAPIYLHAADRPLRRRSIASLRPSSRSTSTASTARGGTATSRRTRKRWSGARPTATRGR